MLPIELRAKGWKGLRNLVGSGELIVDLRGLAGMIGIQGDNGMGKTTFLELIQPHRMMASRGSESLKGQIFSDAHKDLTFQIGGREYRTLTRIKERTGKTEAFIWESGILMNENGNCDIHDEIMARLCGTPEVFFASVFCAQKGNRSRRITELTKGERKGLIIQFLNLAQLEEWQATAKALRDVIATKRQEAQRDADGLRARLLPDPVAFGKEIERIKFQIQDLLLRQGEIESWLEVAQAAEREANAKVKEEGEKDSRKRAMGEEIARIEAKAAKGRGRIKDLEAELSRVKIDDAVRFPEEAKKRIADAEAGMAEAEGRLDGDKAEVAKHEAEIERLNAKLREESEVASEEKSIRTKIETLRRQAEILSKRPAECRIDSCPFIKSAVDAKQEINTLGEKLQALAVPDSASTQKSLNDAKGRMKYAREVWEGRLAEITRLNRMKETEQEKLSAAELAEERNRSLSEKIELEMSAVASEEELLKVRRDEWETIIVDLSWAKKLLDAQADLKKWRDEQATNQRDAEGKRVALATMEIQLKADGEVRERIGASESRITMLGREAGEWDLLQSLCGRDNLQAYEIDASAPIITGLANDLLKTTFGDRFAVRFQTLKDGREVFDVLVYDQEIGEEKDIRDISGGEEVWILKALRLAMTLLTKERSGKTYHTIFGDEEDGKLSIQNRMAYLQMYRKMLAIGGFTSCYLVSHTPELTEACDHRLRFRAGGIDVD